MPTYRIEISPNRRAICKSKDCKDAKVKIDKGEVRFGTWVEIKTESFENQSWAWKHWGCVTPAQIENLASTTGGDLDMLDGYDEIPEDVQEKVQRAIKQGHVDDEDWNGDVEYNRAGMKGMHARTPKKKTDKDEEAKVAGAEDETPAKPTKKRARKVKDEDEDEEPAPVAKKSKKGTTKKADDQAEDVKPTTKKPKKKVSKSETISDNDEPSAPAKNAKAKSSKASGKATESAAAKDTDIGLLPKKKAGRGAKKTSADVEATAALPSELSEEVEPVPKKTQKAKGAKKSKEPASDDKQPEAAATKKQRSKRANKNT